MAYFLLSLGVISLLFIFTYTYLIHCYNYWRNKGIPSSLEKCLPFVGNMGKVLAMREAFSTLCENIYKKNPHQSMIGFYQMLTPSLILRDPELVKKVLITNFSSFEDNQIVLHPELDPLLSKNPFFSQKDTWKENRTVLTNGFSSSKLKLMFTLTRQVSLKFNAFLKTKLENVNSLEFDLKKLFSLYTGEIVSTVGLGVEGDCFKENSQSFGKAVTSVFDNPTINGGYGQVAVFYLPRVAKFLNYGIVTKEMDKFIRESVMKIKETTRGEIPRNDFLHIISESEKEKNAENLAAYMLAFILDAHETTNITLSFLALQLAIHSDVQEKVRREIISIGGEGDENWKYETLNELVYLEQAIFESMRLNSALGSLMKTCTSRVRFDGFDGLSCQVERGNIVVLSVHGLHKDPKYWPEPEKFDPDRFSEENRRDRHKFVFLPFGEGPRMCLGRRLAMMSMKMAMVAVLRNFSLELSPRTCLPLNPDPTSFFTAVDSSMWVIFRPLK